MTALALLLLLTTAATSPGPPDDGATGPSEPALQNARSAWPFVPPRRPSTPEVEDGSWARGPIDRFVLARLESAELRPSAEADRRTLLRRVYLDLLGLPPTRAQIREFLDDDSPAAFDKIVARLLASPRYGERWARHWMDIVRFSETSGHVTDRQRPNAWRYRDYLIDAFNDDLPYGRFVLEHLAGDLLDEPRPGIRGEENVAPAATGYLWFHEMHFRPIDPVAQRADQVDAQIDVIAKAFLGLTAACARCHDHKFDPISQRDYYALAGILDSTLPTQTRLADESAIEDPVRRKKIDQTKAKIRKLVESQRRGVRQRQSKKTKTRVAVTEDNFDAGSRGKLADLRAKLELLDPLTTLWAPAATEGDAHDLRIHLGGDHRHLGDVVPRGFLSVLTEDAPPRFESGSGRDWLARRIIDPSNPLAARVIVNRLWQHHFGTGIVATPNNFGKLGEEPTHPRILDHLATRLVEAGWSLKEVHREILLSSVYRMSSRAAENARRSDPENRLLHHMPTRRLEAEAIRDSILSVAGSMELRMGGPGVRPYISPNASSNKPGNIPKSGPLDGDGRRSVYMTVRRNFTTPFLEAFDFPDPSSSVAQRETTLGPAQSLAMLNSPFVHEQATRWAQLIARQLGSHTIDEIVAAMFESALGRPPGDAESQSLARFVGRQRSGPPSDDIEVLRDVAHLLFNTAEFILVR